MRWGAINIKMKRSIIGLLLFLVIATTSHVMASGQHGGSPHDESSASTSSMSSMDMPDMVMDQTEKQQTHELPKAHSSESDMQMDSSNQPNWMVIGLILGAMGLLAYGLTRISRSKDSSHVNLLNVSIIRKVVMSRLYPAILQIPTAIVFAVIVWQLLAGPREAHDNFGTAATWVLWWPIIPLLFFLLGRFWCSICPFATLSDLVQKVFGSRKPVPRFLRKYGIWIIDAIFILITWSDHTFGIVENPRGSGVLLMMIVLGVTLTGLLFERRTWCRYLCFLGGLSGNYSRAGSLELRATPDRCAKCTTKSCYVGAQAPGCPMFEFPRTMDTNAECNLCGYCVKNCPNDSIRLSPRIPTSELWELKKPRLEGAFLATVIMGIVFVQNITMLKVWKPILAWIERLLGTTNYFATFTLVFLVLMVIPIILLLITGRVTSKRSGKSAIQWFALFGYALIPLDLAGHLAHNLFHLLAEGKSVIITAMGLLGIGGHGEARIVNDVTIQILQYIIVIFGVIGSLYTAYRMVNSNSGETTKKTSSIPISVLIISLGIINLILFYLPMEMRM